MGNSTFNDFSQGEVNAALGIMAWGEAWPLERISQSPVRSKTFLGLLKTRRFRAQKALQTKLKTTPPNKAWWNEQEAA